MLGVNDEQRKLLFEYLRLIEGYTWIGQALAMALILYLAYRTEKISSMFISLGITIFIGGISYKYGAFLYQADPIATKTIAQAWLQAEENRDDLLVLWHGGFAVFDILAIWMILTFHNRPKSKIKPCRVTMMLVFVWGCGGFLNIARWFDKLLGGQLFAELYVFGISSMNIGSSLVCFFVAVVAVWNYHSIKKKR